MSEDPEAIWLSPACDSDTPDGRLWANPAPEDCCDDCGDPWVKYVRADLATPPDTQGAGYGELLERLDELRLFLGGHSALDGCHFGERPADAKGAFWWRPYLDRLIRANEAIQTLTAENERLTAMIEGVGNMALADQETTLSQQARIATLEAKLARAEQDTARLDFLDECNTRLNAKYGTEYGWRLILNHNVNRLMLGPRMDVDLHDSEGGNKKLRSCRAAIDERLRDRALTELSEPKS
jgi:hypothetical protein